MLLLKDSVGDAPSRIGLLDVGGATLEDVAQWSLGKASTHLASRGSAVPEEHQG